MKFYILAAAVIMTGCASTGTGFNNTEVVVSKQYVVRTAPDTLKTLPPLPTRLVVTPKTTNIEVATFINNTEQYVTDLESMVQTLVNFYEKPVTTDEAGTMQPVAPRSTATPTASRVIQPQTTTANASTTSTTAATPTLRQRFSTVLQRASTTK